MIPMVPEDVQVRRDVCADCPTGCGLHRAGLIDHLDPKEYCRSGKWDAWGGYSERPAMPTKENADPRPARTIADAGAELWANLHTRAKGWAGADDSKWLARFSGRVPCGDCRRHWMETLKSYPPDWSDYFGWSVLVHNEVNRRLLKAEMTREQAAEIWRSLS